MAREPGMRGKVAIAGIGESTYYRHGQATDSEFVLTLKAILAAAADAGVDPRRIDGFVSYGNDRNEPARLAAALGVEELRHSSMQWGGGGGHAAGATAAGAAVIIAGLADFVVVFRGLAQGQFGRFGTAGRGTERPTATGEAAFTEPYGVLAPAHKHALKVRRFMHDRGVAPEALQAVSLASYHHAQSNPRAVMYGRPLDSARYDAARWIVEPFRLFDCCQENDGAAALLLVAGDRAADLPNKPAYILAAAAGAPGRSAAPVFNLPDVGSANFATLVPRLYAEARIAPEDIDVVQAYEHFSGGVVMSLVEHGLVAPEEINAKLTFENLIAPHGELPINTSGGHLAECYMHGLNLQVEAVRQIRGQSCNQVPGARISLATAGPLVTPVSSLILGSEEVL